MTDTGFDQSMFQEHVELLRSFLAHRSEALERIQGLLNAQRRPVDYLQDRALLARQFEDCLFTLPAVTERQSHLRGQLEQAHWSAGFTPRRLSALHNDLIAPAEMMIRGFYCWRLTRWPGRNARVRYAQMLFNVWLIRCLELLSMRIWDAGAGNAGERLAQIQHVLDALWESSPPDQPRLVRDARWLVPLAQSPTTDELTAYFDVAKHVAETPADADRIEMQKASVVMIGGHLRSQIRHYCLQDGISIDDDSVVRRTRTSNALDFALLIQGLVPLLEAYELALQRGEDDRRIELAGAILQGISPDPDVFVNRLDLLGPYSMIEHLFVTADRDGEAKFTPMGRRHVRLLADYETLMRRLAKPLLDDCPRFAPTPGSYTPWGAIYGTPSNLTEHMALKTLQLDAETRFALEDVFVHTQSGADKLAWIDGWRQLPHIDPAAQELHEYPQEFADSMFERIEQALRRHIADEDTAAAPQTGRLVIVTDEDSFDSPTSRIDELPVRYIVSSDPQLVADHKADAYDPPKLLRDRQEGHFVASFETPGGWAAIKKDMLTEVLGTGRDAKLSGLPPAAAGVVRLMCLDLVLPQSAGDQASVPPSIVKA